ncbi:hypothetical protein CLD22_16815 [Rubrivivax gelatinosus]|nr:hypothetical protein [Rubrivivax gelatinosus]
MIDSSSASTASRSCSASSSPGAGATRADSTTTGTPMAEQARATIDASRQAGVVNPGELAADVSAAYGRNPDEGAALHAAVKEQLSPRDAASLDEHLAPTLGAVAGARAADRQATVPQGITDRQAAQTADAVIDKARQMGLGDDVVAQGSRVTGTAKPTSDLDLAIRVSPEKFDSFLNTDSRLAQVNPGTSKAATREWSIANGIIQRGEARLSPTGRALEARLDLDVDLSVVRQGGAFDQGPSMAMRSTGGVTVRAGTQGALVGAAADGAVSAYNAMRDGQVSRAEAQEIAANTVRGAVVGGSYAVTEQGLLRVGASRLAGAGVAGAVVGAGLSIYENREGLVQGDADAIGKVAGDTVVAAGAALGGMAAGAAVGSVVPVVGTAVGAVVGLGVGVAIDYVARAGGVDKAIGDAVSSGVDAVKGAASKVAGWFGW